MVPAVECEGMSTGNHNTAGEGMSLATAHALCAVTTAFYEQTAASFSATREHPWPGWQRVAHELQAPIVAATREGRPVSVLDIACGNLRFERFLMGEFPQARFCFDVLDDCAALLPAERGALAQAVRFEQTDLMAQLAAGSVIPAGKQGTYDVAVCFGFMHHVPLRSWRAVLVDSLARALRPGGVAALSLWQFLNSPKLVEKAKATTPRGVAALGVPPLPEGDCLLGWQDNNQVFRYCHHSTDAEVEAWARRAADAARAARCRCATDELSRTAPYATTFHADGRTENLNAYVVLHA